MSTSAKKSAFQAPINRMGTLAMMDLDALQVDPSYQRDRVDPHVRAIARDWDWSATKPLSVARRPGGKFFVFDGQHTLEAARMRGDIKKLPVYVVPLESAALEAHALSLINSGRKRMKAYDIYRADLAAHKDLAVVIQNAFDSYGLTVEPAYTGKTAFNGIGSLYQWLGTRRDKDFALRQLLSFILEVWPDDNKRLSGRFVSGVIRFLSSVQSMGEQEFHKLWSRKERLGKLEAETYLVKARNLAEARNAPFLSMFPEVMKVEFNLGLKGANRLS